MRPFRVFKADTNELLAERVEPAVTFWERFAGLMFRKELPEGHGLLLPQCRSVHTCFMRFPIDLVYICGENEVEKIVPEMKPWRLSLCWSANAILEINAGAAREAGLEEGHALRFEFVHEEGEGDSAGKGEAPPRPC